MRGGVDCPPASRTRWVRANCCSITVPKNRRIIICRVWRYKDDSKGKPKKEEDAAVDSLLADVSQPKRDFSDEEIIARIVAITLNAGAYVSEIFRAGIQSIDKGQMEASRALGMPWWKTMRKVILPQAFRRILPPLGNNAIAIVKDSSLASAIGLADLAYAARTVSGAYATYWEPYLTISLVYWVITFLLAQLVNRLEKRFGKSDSH